MRGMNADWTLAHLRPAAPPRFAPAPAGGKPPVYRGGLEVCPSKFIALSHYMCQHYVDACHYYYKIAMEVNTMRSTVQVRIDEDTRQQASKLFERIGLDIPTAIRMFLKQSIESNGLPFQPMIKRDINGFSQYDAARMERAKQQLEAGGGSFRELIED